MAKLEFPIDKIMSVTDARNNFNKIVEEVEGNPEGKYLLTKGGNPSVVIINADHLEKLIGEKPKTQQPAKTIDEKTIPEPTPPTPPAPQQTGKIIEDKEVPEPTPTAQPTQNLQPTPPSGQTPVNRPGEQTIPYAPSTQPENNSKE